MPNFNQTHFVILISDTSIFQATTVYLKVSRIPRDYCRHILSLRLCNVLYALFLLICTYFRTYHYDHRYMLFIGFPLLILPSRISLDLVKIWSNFPNVTTDAFIYSYLILNATVVFKLRYSIFKVDFLFEHLNHLTQLVVVHRYY